jgi:hypothetical protein
LAGITPPSPVTHMTHNLVIHYDAAVDAMIFHVAFDVIQFFVMRTMQS